MKTYRAPWSNEDLFAEIHKYATRSEMVKAVPFAVRLIKQRGFSYWLDERFGAKKNEKLTDEIVRERMKQCESFAVFRDKFKGTYSWIKRNRRFDLIDGYFNTATFSFRKSDAQIDHLLRNRKYAVLEHDVFYRGNPVNLNVKSAIPYFKYRNTWMPLRRVIYVKHKGKIPLGYQVRKIDPTGPEHIDNYKLVLAANRGGFKMRDQSVRQVNPGNARLTESVVRSIRLDKANGMSLNKIVEKYKVSKSTASYIVNWRTWNHVK